MNSILEAVETFTTPLVGFGKTSKSFGINSDTPMPLVTTICLLSEPLQPALLEAKSVTIKVPLLA